MNETLLLSLLNLASLTVIVAYSVAHLNRMGRNTSHFNRTTEIIVACVAFSQIASYLCIGSHAIACGIFTDQNMLVINLSIMMMRLTERRSPFAGRGWIPHTEIGNR